MTNQSTIPAKIKEAGKHTVIYGFGSTLTTLTAFILIPLYTSCFTPAEYGTLSLILLCATIAGSISYLGIVSALARSYYDYEDGYERKRAISTTFYLLLAGASSQVLVGFILAPHISNIIFQTDAYSLHIFLVLLSSAFGILSNVPYLILKIRKESKVVVTLNIASFLFSIGLILFLVLYQKLGILGVIYGNLAASIFTFCVLMYLIKDQIVLGVSKYESKVQLKWGIAIVLGNFGVLSLNWADRFLINFFSSLSDVGIYALGYTIGMAIQVLFINPFNQIWNPMRLEYRNDDNAKQFYTHMITYYSLIGAFICILLSLYSKELLLLLSSNPEYREAFKVVPFVAFGYLFMGMLSVINHGMIFERKVHYGTIVTYVFAAINFALNLILLPIYGYIGAAFATLVCFFGMVFPIWYISNRYYKMNIEKRRVFIIFLGSFLVLAIGLSFDFTLFMSLIFKSALILVFLACLWLFHFFTPEEKTEIKELIGNLTSKLRRID